MKNVVVIAVLLLCMSRVLPAQLKSQIEQQTSPSQYLVYPTRASGFGSLFNWFNPNRFSMRHNFSMSYLSLGGAGLSLASYTNSIFYQIADPLNVRFDVTLQTSPFGNHDYMLKNALNNLFLSCAEINYQPWQNFHMQLQYRQIPFGSCYGWHLPYRNEPLLHPED